MVAPKRPTRLAQLIAFVRTFRPARGSHLLFLLAALCFFCAPFLGWGPELKFDPQQAESNGDFFRFYGVAPPASNFGWLLRQPNAETIDAVLSWQRFATPPTILVFMAGLVTFAYSVFPRALLRRRWWLVFALAFLGVIIIWARLLARIHAAGSVFDTGAERWSRVFAEIPFFAVALGPGWYATVLGLGVLILALLLGRKKPAALPVQFADVSLEASPVAMDARGKLAWFAVVVLGFVGLFSLAGKMVALLHIVQDPLSTLAHVWAAASLVIATGFPAFCGWRLLEGEARAELRGLFRAGPGFAYGIAVSIPIAAAIVPQLLLFAKDYLSAATFWSTAGLPSIWESLLFSWAYLPLALLEELAWRGYLQPRMVTAFGLRRGVFLVALLWGVWHLPGDLQGATNLGWSSLWVLERVLVAVADSIVLAWLVLRTRSILPAALMHGTINILHFGVSPYFPFWERGLFLVGLAVWAVGGYVLFKYWPPQVRSPQGG